MTADIPGQRAYININIQCGPTILYTSGWSSIVVGLVGRSVGLVDISGQTNGRADGWCVFNYNTTTIFYIDIHRGEYTLFKHVRTWAHTSLYLFYRCFIACRTQEGSFDCCCCRWLYSVYIQYRYCRVCRFQVRPWTQQHYTQNGKKKKKL